MTTVLTLLLAFPAGWALWSWAEYMLHRFAMHHLHGKVQVACVLVLDLRHVRDRETGRRRVSDFGRGVGGVGDRGRGPCIRRDAHSA